VKSYTFVDYATQAYVAATGLLILAFHNRTVPHWTWLLGAHVLGLVLIHGLIRLCAAPRPAPLLNFFRHFYPVLLYAAFFCETGALNRMFFPEFLDPQVAQLEQRLFGCQPSVLFMQKLPWLPVSEVFYASYFSYYVMIGGVGIALFLRNRQQFFHYVSVVSFVFYLCYLFYIIVPVVGSRAFFHQVEGYTLPNEVQQLAVTDVYPDAVRGGIFFRLMAWIYRVFEAPGAALPSSHVAVALCTVFFSFRYLRPIRYAHLAVACLLCLSTVYCRYHYVVDVVGGLLTAAVLVPLGNWLYLRFGENNPDEGKEKASGPGAVW
jgi:membrane-associated phospholipid phosphatase